MQLTDKLIQGLINNYASKGISVQRLLDNPEFKNLPLDKKLWALENYKNQLTATKPVWNYKPVLAASALSGLAGALAFATTAAGAKGLKGFNVNIPASSYAVVGGLSATIAAILAGLKEQTSYNRDTRTYNHLQNNRYLDAIINTSETRTPGPSPEPAVIANPVMGAFNNVVLERAKYLSDFQGI